MLNQYKYYLTFLLIAIATLCQSQVTQEIEGNNKWNPQNCDEIGEFATTVLDSSFFFKYNAVELTVDLINNAQYQECEQYPLLLSIDGFHKFISNNIIESRYLLLEADSIYSAIKDNEHKYNIRNKIFLGINYNVADDTIKSLRYLRDAENLAQKINDQKLLSDAKHNIGVVYLNSGLIDKAEGIIRNSIDIAVESQNLEIVGYASLNLSRVYRTNKKFESAIKKIEEAKIVFTKLNDLRNLYMVEVFLGEVYAEQKDNENAIIHFLNAIEIGKNSNHKFLHGQVYMNLAKVYKTINEEKSIESYENALNYVSVLNKEELQATINSLTNYYSKTKDYKKQDLLIKNLNKVYSLKAEENRVELTESNQREIEFQKEVNQNKILQLKNESSRRTLQLIALASLACLLLGISALVQLVRNKRLTEKVSMQNQLLQYRNTELKNFASIASHDLKAPVRSITGFSSLLERLLPKDSDPRIFEYLEFIKNSSSNMNALVNSLLQFSTLETRKLEVKQLRLLNVIKDVTNDLHSIIKSKNAEIQIDDNLPEYIKADETLLKIVFQNIINNALKFVAKDVTPLVNIKYETKDQKHLIQIIDNGIGIEKEYLEKIFLIFERLHSSQEYEGSGIGLATCKKIMLLHQGDISIDSAVNEGSTFTISLPKNL